MILPTEVPSNRTAATASRYIQTGLLFLVGAAAVILLHLPELMAAPRHNPVTLVLAHLYFLGFGTLITFRVLGQMLQVTTGPPIAPAPSSCSISLSGWRLPGTARSPWCWPACFS